MTPSDKEKADFDQGAAFLADSLPSFWKRLHTNLLKEGFNEMQALVLLSAYINTSCRSHPPGAPNA